MITPSPGSVSSAEELREPGHDVVERRHLGRVDLEPEPTPAEPGDRVAEAGRVGVRIAEVVELHRPGERRAHGRGDREVHLGDPRRQHVRLVPGPLRAPPLPQVVEVEVDQLSVGGQSH